MIAQPQPETVRNIGGFPAELVLDPFIRAAMIVINNVIADCPNPPSDCDLEVIAAYLAAHFAAQATQSDARSLASKSVGGASKSWHKHEASDASTSAYLDMAYQMDSSGCVKNAMEIRETISLEWIGDDEPYYDTRFNERG